MNKKKISIITSIALTIILALGAVAIFVLPQKGDILDDGAKREGFPENTGIIYIDPNIVALAGELNGTPESQAAAKSAFDEINAIRVNSGLKAYTWNSGLEQAAAVRAVEAVSTWSHTRPNGTDYWTVNEAIVYGENLAKGFFGADSAVNGWMNSPAHKSNILDRDFKSAGISIHIAGDQWYWANEFGY